MTRSTTRACDSAVNRATRPWNRLLWAVKSFPGRAKLTRCNDPSATSASASAMASGSPYGLLVI